MTTRMKTAATKMPVRTFLVSIFLVLASGLTAPAQRTERPELVLQTGHIRSVQGAAFGPGGRWVATGSNDSTIRIWQLPEARELRVLPGTGSVRAMAASGDGTMLASAYVDGSVRIWNVESGAEIKAFELFEPVVEAIVFTPDGKSLFAAGAAGKIWRLSVNSGKAELFESGNGTPIDCLTVSADGRILATGGSDKRARLLDTASGKKLRELKNHDAEISAAPF